MRQRGALPRGAGAVRCTVCEVEARADGRGTPIVLRHMPGCPEATPSRMTRTEVQERVERIISDRRTLSMIKIGQIMEIVDEIVDELESRGPASDEDEADAKRRLSALSDKDNVSLWEVDE